MRFTQETDYALRLVYAFSKLPPGTHRSAREIAEKENIPFRFLLRVMGKLKRAKIIASRQGVDGGYRLAKTPGEISLRAIVEAVEGEIKLSRCLKSVSFCSAGYAPDCAVHKTLAVIQGRLADDLAAYNFENLETGETILQDNEASFG
jgi:Rrf2 family protein